VFDVSQICLNLVHPHIGPHVFLVVMAYLIKHVTQGILFFISKEQERSKLLWNAYSWLYLTLKGF